MIIYQLIAGIFKGIRFIMPKPGSVLKAVGFIGVVLGYILNYLILKPISFLAYTFCGLFIYQKGTNHPVVGAIGYMLFFVALSGLAGGKVEEGEIKEQALIRECKEELNIMLNVGNVFMEVVHEYPDITVHLTLFNATIVEGITQKLEHNDIRWITQAEIYN